MTEEIGADNAADDVVSGADSVARPTSRPTPHGDKLRELLNNGKLPPTDLPRVQKAISHYETWIARMAALETTGDERVKDLVSLLNEYKEHIELHLMWDSESEFLYRSKGQLKIDNSILEE